ncbi:MAG: hypothetical protein PHS83_05915 [Clostridia bacterium]|nr:hypothetical protein [Desulfitobacteriaceae bacterium]MDD4146608.1 hypothetical protein [Clostridia bacterium]MDD4665369.1 hypothetical protein [Clostridia bacterium]
MRQKGLALVLMILCMASLLAAMAYTSADVQAGYVVQVANTEQALLALTPNLDPDGTVAVDSGTDGFSLQFGRSGSGEPGVQPGSTYTWQNLVTLTNNSGSKIKVTVSAPSGGHLVITTGENNVAVSGIIVAAGGTLPLTFTVTVPDRNDTSLTGEIIVIAEKVEFTL